MGLFDDIKKGLDIAGGTITGVAPGKRISETSIASLLGGFGGSLPTREGLREGAEDEDGLAAMLDMSFATRTQEVNDQLSKARTPEEFLAANQSGLELFALLNQRESLLASGTALTELQQLFDESDDSEVAIGQLDTLLSEVNTLLTPEGQIADSLSDEDQQFQNLLRRGTELDVLLKEQQLGEAQRQQEFAGVFNLLDVLPAKQRADVVAALLETPLGQNLFFGGQESFSGAPNQGGTPLPSGAQSPGEVFENAFRGGG
ncbi:hypothetical protein LCGC14_1283540 [marine sediment metagenome]|uniref:Uncharacterized protein n=1 Tax=marine sediment metagenome TaxID=412755 RepID=A0A0F9NXM5_9ZZZZ